MIKVGIAGCGSITIRRHAPEYAQNEQVQISGFFDPIQERARALAEQYGGKVYRSYEEMLADKEIDAVSVCSANAFHAPMSIAALQAGKHVLCEKPMAINSTQADEMIAASAKAKRKLMIGHNQRLAPVYKTAKKILDSGNLGKVLSFETHFSHEGPETWGVDGSAATWFFKKGEAEFGALGDLGIHKIDLISWLIQDRIREVCAAVGTLDKKDEHGIPIQVEDNALCILKTQNGVMGSMQVSWTNYGPEDNSTFLYCTGGIMKINSDPDFSIVIHQKNGDTIYMKTEHIQTNICQTKSGVVDAFVDCIIHDTEPVVSGESAAYAIRVVEAIKKACTLSVKVSPSKVRS